MRRKLVLGIAALSTLLPLSGSLKAQDPRGMNNDVWMTADGTPVDPRRPPPMMEGNLVRGQSPEDPSDWVDQGGGGCADGNCATGVCAGGSCGAGSCDSCGPQSCGKAGGIWAMGEWLNWKPHRSFSPFATEIDDVANGLGGTDFEIDPVVNDFDRDTGYRVGGGIILASGWDVGAMYTNFDSEGEAAVGDPLDDSGGINPILIDVGLLGDTSNLLNGEVDFAAEVSSLEYKTYDLEVGKTFRPSANLALRTFGGVRWAQLDQNREISYVDFFETDLETDSAGIEQDIRMQGWGARVGGSVFWDIMGSGFGVFARSSMSIMLMDVEYERNEFALDQEIVAAVSTTTVNRTTLTEQSYDVLPVIETAVGIRGTMGGFFVNAGWDFTHWFDVATELNIGREISAGDDIDDDDDSQLRLLIDRGDLSLEGLFVNGGFVF